MIGKKLPDVTFKTRVRDEAVGGPNPFRWQDKTTADYFKGKRVVLFSLPGAFTPTCSTYQLPDFERLYEDFQAKGIEAIYCLSVNDAFVMNAWGKQQGLANVQLIPDGGGEFTRKMGMLVCKDNLGFGMRSWRYAAIVNDGIVEAWFEEPGYSDNCETDPYGESSPQNVLDRLVASMEEEQAAASVSSPTGRRGGRSIGTRPLCLAVLLDCQGAFSAGGVK